MEQSEATATTITVVLSIVAGITAIVGIKFLFSFILDYWMFVLPLALAGLAFYGYFIFRETKERAKL